MRARLHAFLRRAAVATLAGAVVAAALAWRDARPEGWIDDGLWGLARLRFWHHLDVAGGILAGVALLSALVLRPARARPIALAAVVVVAVWGARLGALAGVPGPTPRPSVLLISVDTLRADRLGTYGYSRPTSPRVDAELAAGGVVFENVISQAPKTTPSHMTMLTSFNPCVHGVTMWEDATAKPVLNPRVTTLAEAFRNAGYATGAFTAGGPMDRARGFDAGFDLYKQGHQIERARSWLATRSRRRPFFLFVHVYDVHDPYVPPRELEEAFAPGYGGPLRDVVARLRRGVGSWDRAHELFWKAADLQDPATAAYVANLYDATIRNSDAVTVAALLDALDRAGRTRDTLVVYTADHGEEFGEHGRWTHDDLHRETLHVPLVLRLPGVLPAGRRVATPARLLDVAPTVLDLVGLPPLRDAQGRSLAAMARGAAEADGATPAAVSEHGTVSDDGRMVAIRDGGFVLLRDGTGTHLYDATRDAAERDDIAAAAPERVAALSAGLDAWRGECARLAARYGPTGAGVAPSEDALRKLRALGYVR